MRRIASSLDAIRGAGDAALRAVLRTGLERIPGVARVRTFDAGSAFEGCVVVEVGRDDEVGGVAAAIERTARRFARGVAADEIVVLPRVHDARSMPYRLRCALDPSAFRLVPTALDRLEGWVAAVELAALRESGPPIARLAAILAEAGCVPSSDPRIAIAAAAGSSSGFPRLRDAIDQACRMELHELASRRDDAWFDAVVADAIEAFGRAIAGARDAEAASVGDLTRRVARNADAHEIARGLAIRDDELGTWLALRHVRRTSRTVRPASRLTR